MLKHTPLGRLGEPGYCRCGTISRWPAIPAWISGQVLPFVRRSTRARLTAGTVRPHQRSRTQDYTMTLTLRPVLDEDHVAIITGGAQNIGEAIARTFAAAGAKVMIADLNGEKAESAAVSIAAETGQQVIA